MIADVYGFALMTFIHTTLAGESQLLDNARGVRVRNISIPEIILSESCSLQSKFTRKAQVG